MWVDSCPGDLPRQGQDFGVLLVPTVKSQMNLLRMMHLRLPFDQKKRLLFLNLSQGLLWLCPGGGGGLHTHSRAHTHTLTLPGPPLSACGSPASRVKSTTQSLSCERPREPGMSGIVTPRLHLLFRRRICPLRRHLRAKTQGSPGAEAGASQGGTRHRGNRAGQFRGQQLRLVLPPPKLPKDSRVPKGP